jgi:sulfotransferase
MLEKIFFQSSMPRSGSTLLQTIMNERPDMYAGVTDPCLEFLYAARSNYSTTPEVKAQDAEVMKKAFAAFCKGGIESYCGSLITEEKYVTLKSRGWSVYRGFLDFFYPDPKIICMVRNLKDVVASYEKIYRKNQHLQDPIRNEPNAQGTSVAKRVDANIAAQNTIGRAIERIGECVNQGYDDKILYVKYEDLCLNPSSEMVRIYNYLGIPYFDHDFDNINQTVVEDDSAYNMGEGLHVIRPKLEMMYSDADVVLGKEVTNWLHTNYRWYYDKFGYKK